MATKRDGSRVVELLMPIEVVGRKIDALTFQPFRYDHFLRWQKGQIPDANSLLCEIAGESMTVIGMLCYPDVDFVMQEFLAHIPQLVREDIAAGISHAQDGEAPVVGSADEPGPFEPQQFGGLGMDIDDGSGDS